MGLGADAVRGVQVSHWGNVAVEERYELRHVGAKQKVCTPVGV